MDSNSSLLTPGMLLLGGLLIIGLASFVTYLITHHYYQQNLRQFLKVNNATGTVEGKDLFEQVSQRIQDLEKQVDLWENEASRQRKHLEGLLLISEASQHQDSPAIVYEKIIDVILEVTGFSSGGIHLMEPEGKFVYLVGSKGVPDHFLRVLDTESLDRSYMQPLSRGEPYSMEEYHPGLLDVPEAALDDEIVERETVKIPLLTGERLAGTLTIFNTKGPEGRFDAGQRWLAAIGRQLGILIDHMRISEQLQNWAILHERERISQALISVANAYLDSHQPNAEIMRMFASAAKRYPEVGRRYCERLVVPVKALLEKYFDQQVQLGEFRKVNLKLAVHAFYGIFLNFIVTQDLLYGKEYLDFPSLDDAVPQLVDLFLKGIQEPHGE